MAGFSRKICARDCTRRFSMKLVLLDRDGVINRDSADFIKQPDEFLPLPGSFAAMAALCQAGFRLRICTNQSGLGRGLFDESALAGIHEKLQSLAESAGAQIDGIHYCPHHPDDHCRCRKPLPGLVHEALAAAGIDAVEACVIGDSYRDLLAGWAAGCEALLVLTGNGRETLEKLSSGERERLLTVAPDLAGAADWLIAHKD
jgi:D-glycero-D-manno-heptose 1,7-bisphosphate phosphatase